MLTDLTYLQDDLTVFEKLKTKRVLIEVQTNKFICRNALRSLRCLEPQSSEAS